MNSQLTSPTLALSARSANSSTSLRHLNERELLKERQRHDVEVTYFQLAVINALVLGVRFFVKNLQLCGAHFQGKVVSYHFLTLIFPSPTAFYALATLPLLLAHGSNG